VRAKTLVLYFILSLFNSGSAFGQSQFGPAFSKARNGKPFEDGFRNIDLARVDLDQEVSTLLGVINGNNPDLARRAAGVALAVLILRPDQTTKIAARRLVPALITHYGDPDPDQPANSAPTDSWKQVVMYILINSDAIPPESIISKMLDDLDRTGDLYDLTAKVAAIELAHLKPLPERVVNRLLSKMDESSGSAVNIIEALGASRVDNPRVIAKIEQDLGIQRLSLPLLSDTATEENEMSKVRQAAANALGQIGLPAAAALPSLQKLAATNNPEVSEETRQAARKAIRLISEPR
jgi:hypothetical protein